MCTPSSAADLIASTVLQLRFLGQSERPQTFGLFADGEGPCFVVGRRRGSDPPGPFVFKTLLCPLPGLIGIHGDASLCDARAQWGALPGKGAAPIIHRSHQVCNPQKGCPLLGPGSKVQIHFETVYKLRKRLVKRDVLPGKFMSRILEGVVACRGLVELRMALVAGPVTEVVRHCGRWEDAARLRGRLVEKIGGEGRVSNPRTRSPV